MKSTWFSRRGFLVAGFAAAAMMFGGSSGWAEDAPAESDPPAAIAVAQPAEAPLDKPLANFLPRGWAETHDEVVVEFSDITRDGKRMTAEVTLTNYGEKTVKGPIRVVIDDIRIEGLKLSNASGEIGEHLQYVDLLVKGKSLAQGKKQVRKLTLESKTQLEEDALVDFAPRFRVLVQADPQGNQQELAFTQEELDKTIAAQNKLDALLKPGSGNKDIFGTATSLGEDGKPYITVYARIPNPGNVPEQMDGSKVKVELKGPFFAQDKLPASLEGSVQATINTDARFSRPVPLGVGITNETDCGYVGTLGARTSWRGGKGLLSNYHVLVPRSKTAVRIMQPAGCSNVTASNSLGNLASYYPITFSTTASNRYDAAMATTTTALVGTRPANNYGTLGSVQSPTLGMYVHKFGRTTRYTIGQINAVNVNVVINGYSGGSARFVGVVQIKPYTGYSQFSAGGDSGSLITQYGTNNGVALLFAGSGATTFACPLPGLMSGFGATLDR